MVEYVRPQGRRVVLLAVLLLGGIGLQVVNPQFVRSFIDAAQAGDPLERLLWLAGAFLAVGFFGEGLRTLTAYVSANVGWHASNALRSDLTRHCLDVDIDFHGEHLPGELLERIGRDVGSLSGFLSTIAIEVIGNMLLLVGVLALVFAEGLLIGTALTLVAIATMAYMFAVRNIAAPYWNEAGKASAGFSGLLEERLAGREDVRTNGGVGYVMQRFYGAMQEHWRTSFRATLVTSKVGNSMWLLYGLIEVGVLALCVWQYQRGAMTLGTVYMVYQYVKLVYMPLTRMMRQVDRVQRIAGNLIRVQELRRAPISIREGAGTPLPTAAPEVEFARVQFRYGDGPTALDDLSFTLPAGRTLGLLGRTGSGKTTLTRLLLRLYDTRGGAVRIGGVDVRDASLDQLRSRVACVTQDVQLFHGSVRDNITFFDRDMPDTAIAAAIDELGLGPWLAGLPDGLDTMIEGGRGLSAGEGQLLAFARVLLRDPTLVILDEASSRLDPVTEARLQHAMQRLFAGRTAIVIAHRLKTVQTLDEILILDAGQIAEQGAYSALAQNPESRLAQLLQRSETGELLA